MDDRPVSGVGAYKINWDEIDEMSNPFGSGGKGLPVKNQPKSVTEPSPQGGRSNDNINQPTNLSVDSNPEKLPKKSPQNPQPLPKSLPKSNNSTEVKQSPNPPSSEASPVVVNEQDVPKNVQKGNIPQCNGELLATPTPQSIPSPEEICEALQSVIDLQSDINPNVGNNLEVAQDHSNESDPSLGEPVENNVENSNVVPDVMQTKVLINLSEKIY